MKLFILKYKKNIISISESKSDMEIFILQCNFNKKDIILTKITNKKDINKYLIKYSDQYLYEYKGYLIPDIDIKYIKYIVNEYKDKIKDTIKSLKFINEECIMTPKDHRNINKCIDTLISNKTNDIDTFINLHDIIITYFNISDMRDMFEFYDKNI